MIENRKFADHKRNLALRKFFNQKIPVGMLAVENCEVSPASAGSVEALKFVGDPGGF